MIQLSRQRLTQLAFYISLAIAMVVGAKLRLPDLDLRPMHVDEAVQAARFGQLLEEGTFDYLPEDGHGPGLLYFTLPLSYLSGAHSYAETSETLLRRVPAIFGLGIIALTFFAFRRWLGTSAAIASGLLVAVSPMMGFYSRYYIMEVPMVFFLLVFLICSWRYLLNPQLPWLIGAGLAGAVMHATKETFGISVVALVIAVAVLGLWWITAKDRHWLLAKFTDPSRLAIHLAIAIPISLIFSAALYSVFFTNLDAIPKSYQTYANYFGRAAGATGHEKPWNYYLELLIHKKMADGFTWSEALPLALAGVGAVAAFTWRSLPREGRALAQILALYTFFSFLIYSLIPYKTPWSILAPLHAAMLLGGFGFCAILRLARWLPVQIVLSLALLAGLGQLASESRKASFPYKGKMPLYAMGRRNPYVYNHTTTGFITNIVKPLQKLLDASPDKERTVIRIIHSEDGWPIPWYFRQYPINPTRPAQPPGDPAPVITGLDDVSIVITDDAYFDAVQQQLGDDFTFTSANLREDLFIYLFYRQSLFDLAHPEL